MHVSHVKNNFSSARIYGGLGAVFLLLDTVVPKIGGFISIVGLILILLAVKNISEAVGDELIYKNFFIAFIAMFLNSIIAIIIKVGNVSQEVIERSLSISGIVTGLIILWIILLVGAFFLRKSYILIGEYTNVQMFKFTGTLYLVGAVLLIIVIGGVVIFIAEILQIISFFSLPESPVTKKYPKNSS